MTENVAIPFFAHCMALPDICNSKMKVYRDLSEVPKLKNLVLTQGTFDGVHLGHRKVLRQVVAQATVTHGESMLLTFYPHPRLVLYPNDNSLRLLNSIEEKTRLVEAEGIDHMLILPFTGEVANLSPLEFVRNILVDKLAVKTMIVGYDHRFGKNREGSFEDLVSFGEMFDFRVLEIPASEIEHIAISSTRIRNALLNNDLALATELLGSNYKISGSVVHGRKLGREIGFPTANIQPSDPYKLIPGMGVYAVMVHLDGQELHGVANIGMNPTIDGKGFSVEVYIFDFDKDIYDFDITLELVRFLRLEERFESIGELQKQIEKDVAAAKAVFSAF